MYKFGVFCLMFAVCFCFTGAQASPVKLTYETPYQNNAIVKGYMVTLVCNWEDLDEDMKDINLIHKSSGSNYYDIVYSTNVYINGFTKNLLGRATLDSRRNNEYKFTITEFDDTRDDGEYQCEVIGTYSYFGTVVLTNISDELTTLTEAPTINTTACTNGSNVFVKFRQWDVIKDVGPGPVAQYVVEWKDKKVTDDEWFQHLIAYNDSCFCRQYQVNLTLPGDVEYEFRVVTYTQKKMGMMRGGESPRTIVKLKACPNANLEHLCASLFEKWNNQPEPQAQRISFLVELSVALDQDPNIIQRPLSSEDENEDLILPFDRVILNEGEAFSAADRSFICPEDGLYNFFVMVNGPRSNVQISVKSGSAEMIEHYISRNVLVKQCRRNDRVYVSLSNRIHEFLLQKAQNSVFGGYRIETSQPGQETLP